MPSSAQTNIVELGVSEDQNNSNCIDVQCKNLIDFKEYTNKEYKPVRCKHFSRGSKIGNKLLTKIRVGRSDLNQHKHVIGLSDTPECLCHFRQESPLHYFIDCFLYLPERQTLFSLAIFLQG